MRDTPAAIEARFHRQLMSLKPEERLAMTCRMFSAAQALVRAASSEGNATSREKTRSLLFLRFYGQDFSETDRLKILAHLKAT